MRLEFLCAETIKYPALISVWQRAIEGAAYEKCCTIHLIFFTAELPRRAYLVVDMEYQVIHGFYACSSFS